LHVLSTNQRAIDRSFHISRPPVRGPAAHETNAA
jgi:hypothetical protein